MFKWDLLQLLRTRSRCTRMKYAAGIKIKKDVEIFGWVFRLPRYLMMVCD